MVKGSTCLPPETPPSHRFNADLAIVAEGGPGVGAGHVMRCLALADAWRAVGGRASFVGLRDDDLIARVRRGGVDARAEMRPDLCDGSWLIVDGYRLDDATVAPLAVQARGVVSIDDQAQAGRTRVDVVVDQNLGTEPTAYCGVSPDASLCIGPAYALLRGVVVEPTALAHSAATVLVNVGGAPTPELLAFVEAVLADPVLESTPMDVIGNVPVGRLGSSTRRRVMGMVDEVAGVLQHADVALSPAGSTLWDLCRHGVPTVAVVAANNQAAVARAVAETGFVSVVAIDDPAAAVAALSALVADPNERDRRAAIGRALVDGRGAERVVTAIRARDVPLRPAVRADASLLFEWVNDPAVRAASFTTDAITWSDHEAWFEARLRAPDTCIYLVDEERPWGQVRFNLADGRGEIDFSVAPTDRGQGWAAPLLRAATERLWLERPDVVACWGEIRAENRRSQSVFGLAGYEPIGSCRSGEAVAFRRVRETSRG